MFELAPLNRPERLSAIGRLFLTVATLTAFTFDRDFDPMHSRHMVVAVLQVYLVYSVLAAIAAWIRPLGSPAAKLASHGFDLAVAAFLNFVVEGSNSPFFALFIFALFSASLRFGSRGVIVTGGLVLTFFGSFGVVAYSVPEIDLTRFAVRSSYLVVVIVLLTYLTAYLQSLRDQMAQLALWPREWRPELATSMEDLFRRAASLLRVKTVVALWEDSDEPWLYVAEVTDDRFAMITEPPDRYQPMVQRSIEGTSFLVRQAGGAFVLHDKRGSATAFDEPPVNPALLERYHIDTAISSAFRGENLAGRAFFIGRTNMASDEIVLAEIVTSLIGLSLQQHLMVEQLKRTAVSEERIRMARDLHDGIVQSLAGVTLHLHALDRLIEDNPAQARQTLREIQEALLTDQRELRSYIAQLRPIIESADASTLSALIDALARRVEQQWGVKVSALVDDPVELISAGIREEVFRLAREGVINAAKHAQSTAIGVVLRLQENRVAITIDDNGRGLPFTGRYTLAELRATRRGPITLKERVALVGGDLVIDTSSAGTRIEIEVPLSLFEVRSDHTRVAGG
jgi:signal transduction histidine kinase